MSKMTKGDMLDLIVHDIWELGNKPARFFSSLRKAVELYHKNDKVMNECALAGSKKDTLLEVDKLEKLFRSEYLPF